MLLLHQEDFMGMIQKNRGNIWIQIQAMKSKYPQFKSKIVGNNTVIFTGDMTIKPEMPKYRVSITYNGNSRAKVKVITPQIDDNAPHTFSDGSLCLYHNDNYHWNAKKLIASDIIQWTVAWIYFYEVWKDCGVWLGPEAEHNINLKKYDE